MPTHITEHATLEQALELAVQQNQPEFEWEGQVYDTQTLVQIQAVALKTQPQGASQAALKATDVGTALRGDLPVPEAESQFANLQKLQGSKL